MTFASLNGAQIVSGSITVPEFGAWSGDVVLAGSNAIASAQKGASLVIGNLTLVGTAYRTASFAGASSARLVAGGAGWMRACTARQYHQDGGVKLSMVLGDLASESGESVNVAKDASLGTDFVRVAGPAAHVLNLLSSAWWIDSSGTTQLGQRPTSTIVSDFTVVEWSGAKGRFIIGTEDFASWLPGATFRAPNVTTLQTVSSVTYRFDNDGTCRLEVLAGASADRLADPLRQLVAGVVAPTVFHGRYRYTIANTGSDTIDCTPVNTTLGLPALNSVKLMSDSISSYTPPQGANCHVMFLDGDPTLPCIVWTEGQPTMASLLGGPNPVARQGDQTQSFLPPSLVIQASGTINGLAAVMVGTLTVPNPITGTITQGSAQVSCA